MTVSTLLSDSKKRGRFTMMPHRQAKRTPGCGDYNAVQEGRL